MTGIKEAMNDRLEVRPVDRFIYVIRKDYITGNESIVTALNLTMAKKLINEMLDSIEFAESLLRHEAQEAGRANSLPDNHTDNQKHTTNEAHATEGVGQGNCPTYGEDTNMDSRLRGNDEMSEAEQIQAAHDRG